MTWTQEIRRERELWSDPRSGIRIHEMVAYSLWWTFAAIALLAGCITHYTLDTWVPILWVWPVLVYNFAGVWALKTERIATQWLPTICAGTALTVVGYVSAVASHMTMLPGDVAKWWALGLSGLAVVSVWVYGVAFKASWHVPEVAAFALAGLIVPPLTLGVDLLMPLLLLAPAVMGLAIGGRWATRRSRQDIATSEQNESQKLELKEQLDQKDEVISAKDLIIQAEREERERIEVERRKRLALGQLEGDVAAISAREQKLLMIRVDAALTALYHVEHEVELVQDGLLDPHTREATSFLIRHLGEAATAVNNITSKGVGAFVGEHIIDIEIALGRALQVIDEVHPEIAIHTHVDLHEYREFRWTGGEASFAYCLVILARYFIERGATQLWVRLYYERSLFIEIEADAEIEHDHLPAFWPERIRARRRPGWGLELLPVEMQRVVHTAAANSVYIEEATPKEIHDHPRADHEAWSGNDIFQVSVVSRVIPNHPSSRPGPRRPANPYKTIGDQRPKRKGDLH